MATHDGIEVSPFSLAIGINLATYNGGPVNLGLINYTEGYDDGFDDGEQQGYADGLDDGYDDGFLEAQEVSYAYPGAVIVVTAQDYAGAPVTGLSPTWHCHFNSTSGDAVAGPSITAVGGGHYKFTPTGTAPAGIIDLGAATPRYWFYNPVNVNFVFVAYDDEGQPLAGLSPTWVNLKFVADGTDASQPAIEELGDGLYKTSMFEDHVVGLIDMGEDAWPRYQQYDSESFLAPGYALGFTDGQNNPAQTITVQQLQDTNANARMMNPSTGLPLQLDTLVGIVVELKKFGQMSFNVITPVLSIVGEYLQMELVGATHLDTVGLGDLHVTVPGRLPVAFKLQVTEPPMGDVTAPTIQIVSPPQDTVIGQSTEIVFRYLDESSLRRPMPCIKIKQPDDSFKYELIHDGDNFTPDYTGVKSVVQADPPIWEYKVRRRGGWGATVAYHGVADGDELVLVPFGTDQGGNEPA